MSIQTAAERQGPGLALPVAAIVGALAVAAGLWLGSTTFGGRPAAPKVPVLTQGTALPQPRPLADFSLVDQDGQPFALANLKGHWTFLSIGYTSCPDICPMTMATYQAMARRLTGEASEAAEAKGPRFLFVSVDPGRDTPERLAQYVRWFDPGFLGATGEDGELRALAAQLGVLYARVDGQETAMGYTMDHSASILLIDPQARLAAVFGAPHDAAGMATDFLALASGPQP